MPSNSPYFWFATWFGAGLSPKAPGTVGTLATVPAHFLLIQLPFLWHLVALAVLILAGTWCANKLSEESGLEDPQIVVIDESAGVLLALFLAGTTNWIGLIAAVALFRLLDIAKPWPISAAENLKPAGVGIMADDLVAGLAAGLIVALGIQYLA